MAVGVSDARACSGVLVRFLAATDFVKQNDRNSAARPLTDIPTKLLKRASMSLHGRLPLTGRERISYRVRWCFRFIPEWNCFSVPGAASG